MFLAAFFLVVNLYRPALLRAQHKPLEGIFIFAAGQYFIVPDLSGLIPELPGGSLITPLPGFRAGLGYEWKNLRLSLESGWTKIKGDNPLVLEADMIPFMVNGCWDFTIFEKAGIRFGPALGFGLARVTAEHYRTALALITEDLSHTAGLDFLVYTGLGLSWAFHKAFSLYAEGGVSLVPEIDGLIPLPEIRAGIRLRPFALSLNRPAKAAPQTVLAETGETPETGAAVEIFREVYTVYFGADSVVPLESSLDVLEQAGNLLARRSDLQVTLEGYAAPFVSAAGQMAVSEQRMRYCAEYLETGRGIAAERITRRWFGAEKAPQGADGSYDSLRVVEITIELFGNFSF